MKQDIIDYLDGSMSVTSAMINNDDIIDSIYDASKIMVKAIHEGNKILSCGNGGSMCDAMHFASELTGRYKESRDPIAAFALSDAAAMTCISNDFGYDKIFLRQINALGNRGDVLLAITTSGKSANVLSAIYTAKEKGMKIISLTGATGMSDNGYSDVQIKVPSTVTNHVQEAHIKIIHILVEIIEANL